MKVSPPKLPKELAVAEVANFEDGQKVEMALIRGASISGVKLKRIDIDACADSVKALVMSNLEDAMSMHKPIARLLTCVSGQPLFNTSERKTCVAQLVMSMTPLPPSLGRLVAEYTADQDMTIATLDDTHQKITSGPWFSGRHQLVLRPNDSRCTYPHHVFMMISPEPVSYDTCTMLQTALTQYGCTDSIHQLLVRAPLATTIRLDLEHRSETYPRGFIYHHTGHEDCQMAVPKSNDERWCMTIVVPSNLVSVECTRD